MAKRFLPKRQNELAQQSYALFCSAQIGTPRQSANMNRAKTFEMPLAKNAELRHAQRIFALSAKAKNFLCSLPQGIAAHSQASPCHALHTQAKISFVHCEAPHRCVELCNTDPIKAKIFYPFSKATLCNASRCFAKLTEAKILYKFFLASRRAALRCRASPALQSKVKLFLIDFSAHRRAMKCLAMLRAALLTKAKILFPFALSVAQPVAATFSLVLHTKAKICFSISRCSVAMPSPALSRIAYLGAAKP